MNIDTSTEREHLPARPKRLLALRRALAILAFTGAGAALGYFGASITEWAGLSFDLDLTPGELIGLIVLIAPIWLLVVLAHEAGHLAGGMLAGLRPALLIVGPLKLTWVAGRPRPGLNRSLALAGGVASAIPDTAHQLRRRMLAMVLGGPAGSLLLGLGALAAVPLASGLPAAALLMAGILALTITLVTLIPMRADGFSSDGARVRMLLRGGPDAERWCAGALIIGAAMAGQLASLDPQIVARVSERLDETPDGLSAAFLAYCYHLARGELLQAGAALDHTLANLSSCPSVLRPAVLAEAAYFTARHRGEAVAARGYLDQLGAARGIEAYTRRRAEAAVLHAEGQHAEARAAAEAGLKALVRARLGAAGVWEEQLLAELR